MNKNSLPWLSAKDARLVREDGIPLILRGFGLGGWLLPEGYMWRMPSPVDRPSRMEALISEACGREWAESFWRRYRDVFITEEDIRFIASKGYNSVRLPFNSRNLFRLEAGSPAFDEEVAGRIDACLRWCAEAGIYLVLDMHGAPGGQTGANIDDSAHDLPELFTEKENQDLCVEMWRLLASRYAFEPALAGYDLLNEPLAPPFAELAPRVIPLYLRIRDAIRSEDPRHLIILEGTRWASDLEIFNDLEKGGFDGNWMLQFHKYWNDPYEASIQGFLRIRERLQVPLYMGEGGENNLDWYTAAFPMLESKEISWNFWTYKKMDCANSPVSFPRPEGWPPGARSEAGFLERDRTDASRRLMEAFLAAIDSGSVRNEAVLRALDRRVPTELPAECFDRAVIACPRRPGAELRLESGAAIFFHDGHQGRPDFQRMAGEEQPEDQRLCVELVSGESLEYTVSFGEGLLYGIVLSVKVPISCSISVSVDGRPAARFDVSGREGQGFKLTETRSIKIGPGRRVLGIRAEGGRLLLHRIMLKEDDEDEL